jgi:hypothetical protein
MMAEVNDEGASLRNEESAHGGDPSTFDLEDAAKNMAFVMKGLESANANPDVEESQGVAQTKEQHWGDLSEQSKHQED